MKTLFFVLIAYNLAVAQTTASVTVNATLIPIARLDLRTRGAITLNLVAPTESGNQLNSSATNNTKWMNFTSAVPPGVTRRITGQVTGTIPPGINVNLGLSTVAGSGSGPRGTSVALTTFTNTAQTIINGIGGAFTGNGANNGYQLTYSLSISNYSLLRSNSSTITIVYTLIDN